LASLVSASLGIGFVPEWTQDLPNRGFELKTVRGVDFKIGLGVALNREDPTAGRDDNRYRPVAGAAGEVRGGRADRGSGRLTELDPAAGDRTSGLLAASRA
jgi:hypothetical protein